MGNITIRVITETQELQTLASLWDGLLEKILDDNSMYLTHEWISTWWKYYGARKELCLLLIEKGSEVIGIVPLIRNEYRIAFIKLYALESLGRTSCNFVGLILPEHREEAIQALLAYIKAYLLKNGVIMRLSLVPEDSHFLNILRNNIGAFSKQLVFRERVKTLAPYIVLPATWDEYSRSLGGKRRWLLRRKSRSLEQDEGFVEFKRCTADSLDGRLNEFFNLHQSRWQSAGISGTFAEPRAKEFYKEVARKFLHRQWLHFSFLTANNQVVSSMFNCIYNRKLWGFTVARDISYLKYSVGHLHEMHVIKDAIRENLREYDFLQGDEPYKFYWAKSVRRYMQVTIIKRGFLPGLRMKLVQAFLRICEIKQYSLSELYSIYRIKRRERRDHRKMGLSNRLATLKHI